MLGRGKKSLVVAMATGGERFQSGLGHYAVCWGAALRLIAVWAEKEEISNIDERGSHQNGGW